MRYEGEITLLIIGRASYKVDQINSRKPLFTYPTLQVLIFLTMNLRDKK